MRLDRFSKLLDEDVAWHLKQGRKEVCLWVWVACVYVFLFPPDFFSLMFVDISFFCLLVCILLWCVSRWVWFTMTDGPRRPIIVLLFNLLSRCRGVGFPLGVSVLGSNGFTIVLRVLLEVFGRTKMAFEKISHCL